MVASEAFNFVKPVDIIIFTCYIGTVNSGSMATARCCCCLTNSDSKVDATAMQTERHNCPQDGTPELHSKAGRVGLWHPELHGKAMYE